MTINDKSLVTEKPVWLITGCSTGFGHELAGQTLGRGFRTVVTARNPVQVSALAALGDVLVNNAGIGYFAAIEDGENDAVRRLFETNVFGLTHMITADYATTAGKGRKQLRTDSGHQPGDPVIAARDIIRAIDSTRPPHRLLLGNDAYDGAIGKLDRLRDEFQAGEAEARAADH